MSALPTVENATKNDKDLFSIVPSGTSTFSNVTVTTEAPVVEPTDPKLGTGTKTTNGSEEVTLEQTFTSPTNWVVTQSVTKKHSTVEKSVDKEGANQDFTREGEETFTVTVINGTTTITTYSITDTFSYESGDVDGVVSGSSPASWSIPTEWKNKAETPPAATVSTDPVPGEGETIVADDFTPAPGMIDADESEVSVETESFGARFTSTVSFSVSVIEALVTLPDGRSGRTTSVSIGSSNSLLSLANGEYSSSNSEGTLDDVTIASTKIDDKVVLSVPTTPTGNGHSVDSSGSFISYASAGTSLNVTATITVADGDDPADAKPSGSARFSTNSGAGAAADSSLNGTYQSSGADGGYGHVTIEASSAGGGSRHFNFSADTTFGPGVTSGGTTTTTTSGSGTSGGTTTSGGTVASSVVSGGSTGGTGGTGGSTSGSGSGSSSNSDLSFGRGNFSGGNGTITYAGSRVLSNSPDAYATETTVLRVRNSGSSDGDIDFKDDELTLEGNYSFSSTQSITVADRALYQQTLDSRWEHDMVHTSNSSFSSDGSVSMSLGEKTFSLDTTYSVDVSSKDTADIWEKDDHWELDDAGNQVKGFYNVLIIAQAVETRYAASDTKEFDGKISWEETIVNRTVGGPVGAPAQIHQDIYQASDSIGLGASAPPPTPSTARPVESILEEYRDRREQVYRLQALMANTTNPDLRAYYQDVINDHTNILNDLTSEATAAGVPTATLTQIDTEAVAEAAGDPIELQEWDGGDSVLPAMYNGYLIGANHGMLIVGNALWSASLKLIHVL